MKLLLLRRHASQSTRSIMLAAIMLASAVPAHAEPPACSDKIVKDNIEHDADKFLDQAHKLPGVADEGAVAEMNERSRAILFPTIVYEVNLSEMYETSHTEAIRSCAGKLTLKSADRTDADVGLTYDAVKTEDGKTLYRVQNGPGLFFELIQNYVKLNQLDPLISENQQEILEKSQRDLANALAGKEAVINGGRGFSNYKPDASTMTIGPNGAAIAAPGSGSHFGQGGPVPGPMSGSRRTPQ